jgi:putative FmdB family regulatory protein
MPTYAYRCQACKHEFERVQRMTEDALKECPECQGQVKRLIGAGAGLLFKGSGFYITDYRSDSYKKGAKADTGTSTPPTPPSSTSTSSGPSTPSSK